MESKSVCTRGAGETENLQMYADTSEGTSEGHFLQAIARYMDGQDDMFSDVDTGGNLWILVIAAAWLVKTEGFRGRPCGKKRFSWYLAVVQVGMSLNMLAGWCLQRLTGRQTLETPNYFFDETRPLVISMDPMIISEACWWWAQILREGLSHESSLVHIHGNDT